MPELPDITIYIEALERRSIGQMPTWNQTMKDNSFKEFVLDQLHDLGRVSCRAMFGGYGIYQGNVFFGILYKGRLYFKTDPMTHPEYIEKGMKPFRPNAKMTLKTYYEVPADIIEDPDQLVDWAKRAIQCRGLKRSPISRKR